MDLRTARRQGTIRDRAVYKYRQIAIAGASSIVLGLSSACSGVADEGQALQLANPNPPGDSSSHMMDWWSEEVEAKVSGVEIDQKYSGSLLAGDETRAGIGDGRAAGGQVIPAYHPSEMPLSNISGVPVPYDTEVISKAFWKLIQENEQVAAEFGDAGLEPMFIGPLAAWLLATKQGVTRVKDLEGLSIRLLPAVVPAYETFGVEPSFVASDELYESLERGVIDGVSSTITNHNGVGVQEVAPHFTVEGLGNHTVWVFALNKELLESLDEETQAAMREVAGRATEEGSAIVHDAEVQACQAMQADGATFSEYQPEDLREIEAAASDLVNSWYALVEKAGYERSEAEAIWDEYNSYLEEFEPTSTFRSGVEKCL